LLTLTHLESDTDGAPRSPVNLAELIREVIENAEFESRNATRSVRLVECTPCGATVVPELLRRAFENVVRNALAYTADGTAVEISLGQDATHTILRVRDHGPGVPEAELADIFRPFYRVSRARERQTGGVGLGLAITARAVHSHGGNVVATNHPEGGLAVEIRLPRDVHAA
jgi:two-component system sensor histidine kinase CpxA